MIRVVIVLLCYAFTCEVRCETNAASTMKVVWQVPTNVWPVQRLWVYKVAPHHFAAPIISNVLALGSLTAKDSKPPSRDLLAADKTALYFENKKGERRLTILPTLGYIEYRDNQAQARFTSSVKDVPEPVVGVPDEMATTRLGLKYLQLLGIDRSQIARKFGTCDLDLHWSRGTRSWADPATKQEVNETNNFGVFFTRSIDGVPLSGFGDVFVSFGNNTKLFKMTLS